MNLTNNNTETERLLLSPDVDLKTRFEMLTEYEEEAQVVVHFSFKAIAENQLIRIWKSTFLFPHNAAHKSKLLHCENIPLFPNWLLVEANQTVHFTLFFSGLPRDCHTFDLLEIIPQEGAFELRNIRRNDTDVYHLSYN